MTMYAKLLHAPILAVLLLGSFVTEIAKAQNARDGNGTGSSSSPSTEGARQPQGWTGPLTTGSSGAPGSSPQGETPPEMQAAPEGSSKSTKSPEGHSQ